MKIEYWYVIFGLMAVVALIISGVFTFLDMSRKAQIEKVSEWLKYAVLQAEKELGTGTGMAKLSMVYDMFVARFPWVAKVITFMEFSALVDTSLVWLRNQLETNANIKEIVDESK